MKQAGGNKNKNEKHFRFIDFIVIILFLSIALYFINLFRNDLLHTISVKNLEPVGTVIVKKNSVQRRLSDRVIWDRLARESPVYPGDLIRIGDVSAATLILDSSSIDIDENTIIRVTLSPDGELLIQIDSGDISVIPSEDGKKIILEVEGKRIQANPGEVLTASVTQGGATVETSDVTEWLDSTGRLAVIAETKIKLLSPAINSLFRYQDNPVINFNWEEIEQAVFYEIQISNTPDFSNLLVRESCLANFKTETRLAEGQWFWRVRPVFNSAYNTQSVFSDVSFFNITKETVSIEQDSLTDWFENELTVMTKLSPDIPAELIPSYLAVVPPPLPPQTEIAPPPPPLLSAPRNLIPVTRTIFGYEQLHSGRNIHFSWQGVQGANAYIFTLYHQTGAARQRIMSTEPLNRTSFTFYNLKELDRGTFMWQVEAVRVNSANLIQQRGTLAQNIFTIDFPSPQPVMIQDTGVLYGE